MKFGTLEGVRENVAKLQSYLKILGPKGTISIAPDGDRRWIDLTVSESVSVQLSVPFTLDYRFEAGVLVITFRPPLPAGRYKLLSRNVSFVEITTARIDIGLDWSPDGYLEIVS